MILYNTHVKNANNILIFTDLEPDDLVAIYILSKHITKNQNVMIVVGEGNSYIKFQRMQTYIHILNIKATIIQGYNSNKDFTYDGEDIFSSDHCRMLRDTKKDLDYDMFNLLNFIKKKPIIFCFKPPRELIEFNYDFFSDITLFGYMSFNVRCLQNTEKVSKLLNSFKLVIYYESFLAIGSNNSISYTLPNFIDKVNYLWNKDIIEDCRTTIKRLQDKTSDSKIEERIKQNQKIIDNIEKSNYKQFVNADCGMICTLLLDTEYYYGTVTFNGFGYSVPQENKDGNMLFVKDSKLLDKQIKMYDELFN